MTEQHYPFRVRNNILPLSVSDNLPEAFQEWFFTEEVYDHGEAIANCGLCDQEELRYHFKIRNEYTDKELWVGSKCILNFGVPVFQGDIRLETADAKRKLEKLTRRMQYESCISALEGLTSNEHNEILSNALAFYKKNKYLTPKFAFVVFWRLKENHIDYHPSFFRINLQKDKYKNDLRDMQNQRVHVFWKALTPAQRRLAVRLGHTMPVQY
jgi:hypothetical protein